MKIPDKYQRILKNADTLYATTIRILLYAVLVIVVLALAAGVIRAGIDLVTSLDDSIQVILQKIVIDAIFIIALVEISIIVLGYLRDGKVRLRYIVDTVLIIMVNEVVSAVFHRPSLAQAGSLAIIIITLLAVRLGVMYIETNTPKGT